MQNVQHEENLNGQNGSSSVTETPKPARTGVPPPSPGWLGINSHPDEGCSEIILDDHTNGTLIGLPM